MGTTFPNGNSVAHRQFAPETTHPRMVRAVLADRSRHIKRDKYMVYSFRITVIELLLSLKFLSVDQHSRDNEPPWCELALGRKTAFVTNQAFVTLLKKL